LEAALFSFIFFLFFALAPGMGRIEKKVGSDFGSGFKNFLRIGFRVEKKTVFRMTRPILNLAHSVPNKDLAS